MKWTITTSERNSLVETGVQFCGGDGLNVYSKPCAA